MDDAPAGRLSGDQIVELGVDDWRSMHETLQARFRPADFAAGLEFVNAIGAAADEMDHHPDIDLRYGLVNVRLVSHDVHAKTQRDVDLARRISELAAERGIRSDPAAVSMVEIGLDTWDADEIRPFWQAVLGVSRHLRFTGDLVDPEGHLPTIWFQTCEPHEVPQQRFHLDIRVPPEVAELADAQGNKVCVCTHVGRSD
ncbi:4a-hydroxytetrahydrobiopterin dehydratase [Microlunatus sp. Y2014]|uniref:4a-hydroxytetrahydrobiopterin dehydratase n=1 Tax=Microlunatus sp. Y2014 TaxID=3418488 RepID=UPI003DA76C1E